MEEIMEMLALKQLEFHSKPIVLVNTNGFYDRLLHFFDQLYDEKFARRSHKNLYRVASNPAEAMSFVNSGDTILNSDTFD